MYRTARPEKRKAVAGLLLSAALTSMITGITSRWSSPSSLWRP